MDRGEPTFPSALNCLAVFVDSIASAHGPYPQHFASVAASTIMAWVHEITLNRPRTRAAVSAKQDCQIGRLQSPGKHGVSLEETPTGPEREHDGESNGQRPSLAPLTAR